MSASAIVGAARLGMMSRELRKWRKNHDDLCGSG